MPMNKTLFEKLAFAGETFTIRQSVTDNISRILNSGGFLDAAIGGNGETGRVALGSIYRNGMPSIIDQGMGNQVQQAQYRATLAKLLLRFEPRLKSVTVSRFIGQGMRSSCRLKMALMDDEFEQDFVFG
jgi:predicted component of type VI protein secretion system